MTSTNSRTPYPKQGGGDWSVIGKSSILHPPRQKSVQNRGCAREENEHTVRGNIGGENSKRTGPEIGLAGGLRGQLRFGRV